MNSLINKDKLYFLIGGLFLLVLSTRLFPHPYNFSPLGGLALLTGIVFRHNWLAIFGFLCLVLISDVFVNNLAYAHLFQEFTFFYDGFYWQLGAYLCIVLFSWVSLKSTKAVNAVYGGVCSAIIFFLISNFGCWAADTSQLYSKDFTGLIQSYTAGLPFFKGSLLGDVAWSLVLFKAYDKIYFYLLKEEKQTN